MLIVNSKNIRQYMRSINYQIRYYAYYAILYNKYKPPWKLAQYHRQNLLPDTPGYLLGSPTYTHPGLQTQVCEFPVNGLLYNAWAQYNLQYK